jgi:hypothetical protein
MRKMVALEKGHHITNLYCHKSSRASVVPISKDFFVDIVNEEKYELMPKIWKRVVSRILDLHSSELGQDDIFKGLTQEAVKFFC